MKKKAVSLLLTFVMLLSLIPTAWAAGTTAQVAISACTKIGENDDGYVYYYTAALPADTTEVEFTDLADKMEEGMIASLADAYEEGTNKVPVSSAYAVSVNADELDGWTFDEGYSAADFADDYAYWIMDDGFDMYFVILHKEPAVNSDPFTASACTVTGPVADGYVYSGFVYAPDDPAADEYGYIYPESKAALYTLTVPYGTNSVKLDFGTEQRLVYNYDAYGTYISGKYDDPTVGETTATVSVDSNKDGTPDYIWVQKPYHADDSGGELLYVIKLVYSYTFTASVNNEELAITSSAENAYTYTDRTSAPHVMNLYVLTIPDKTESVALTFSDPVLAYNYGGSNVTDSDYIAGAVGEYMVGRTAYEVAVDANNNGALDYVQVQTPYFDGWSSDCLYAITFRYANAGAGGGNGTETMGTEISDAYAATKKLLSDRMSGYVWGGGTSNSDDWDAFGLARDGVNIPQSYYESVVAAVQENKLTGDARSILTLMAAGYDPATVNGTDLMKALADQVDAADSNCGFGAWGIYSIPWVLIALNNDRATYKTPCSALMNWLVNNQKESGAWGYQSDDVDLTAEAISALAPYYTSNSKVKAAVDRALTWLAAQQKEDGSFHYNGAPSVESTSQVVVALTDLGIDPTSWNDKDAVSAMCTMALPAGGFTYGGSYNEISTYEGFYALVAYYRFLTGQSSLYDMSDVALHEDGHVLGAYQRNADEHWKECAVCHAVFDKAAHIYDSGKVTTPATCTATGIKTYTCTKCGATKTETINAAGHNWTNATCTAPKTCRNCGLTEGTARLHSYGANGICSACGTKNPLAKIDATKVAAVDNSKVSSDNAGKIIADDSGLVVKTGEAVTPGKLDEIKAALKNGSTAVKSDPANTVEIPATSDGTTELTALANTLSGEQKAEVAKLVDKLISMQTDTSKKNEKVEMVLDLSVALKGENGAEVAELTVLPNPVTVRIPISDDIYAGLQGKSIVILRSHTDVLGNTVVKELTAKLGGTGGSRYVEFESDQFSTFALVSYETVSHGSGHSSTAPTKSFATDLSGITAVYVDGVKLDSKYYTVSGTTVTLSESFLKTLKDGKHTFKAENATHIATATFRTSGGSAVSPRTADSGILLYGALSVMSLLGMGYMGKKRH